MKERLVAVVGPTAVGKTKVGVELAKAFRGEIINGDSMQVYKGLDIGTAKPTEKEKKGVPHHLFDILEPDESFSVADFQNRAIPLVTEINERNCLPIVVGGTGLYVKALTHHYRFSQVRSDPDFRKRMEEVARSEGEIALHERLQEIDREAAAQIHPNNVKRIIRALEIYHLSGEKPSQRKKQKLQDSPYALIVIGLTMDRRRLYERINRRVDKMVEDGLFSEVEKLYRRGIRHCQSVQGIGYKEIYLYFDGLATKSEAIRLLKRNTRRYAKRQLTWFRRQMDVNWFEVQEDDFAKKVDSIKQFLAGKLKKIAN